MISTSDCSPAVPTLSPAAAQQQLSLLIITGQHCDTAQAAARPELGQDRVCISLYLYINLLHIQRTDLTFSLQTCRPACNVWRGLLCIISSWPGLNIKWPPWSAWPPYSPHVDMVVMAPCLYSVPYWQLRHSWVPESAHCTDQAALLHGYQTLPALSSMACHVISCQYPSWLSILILVHILSNL